MKPFEFVVHWKHDPYDGELTYPDKLQLVCGHKVLASIEMAELKAALEKTPKY